MDFVASFSLLYFFFLLSLFFLIISIYLLLAKGALQSFYLDPLGQF